MTTPFDFLAPQGYEQMTAGEIIAVNDLLLMGPDGTAFRARCTNTAVVSNALSDVIASTTIAGAQFAISNPITPNNNMVFDSNYNLFELMSDNTVAPLQALKIVKYGPDGSLLGSLQLDGGASPCDSPKIVITIDGHLACTWYNAGHFYAVVDSNLQLLKAATQVGANVSTSAGNQDIIALSGGGFAICVGEFAAGAFSGKATYISYDSSGTVVQALTSIFTHVGAAGFCNPVMRQRADGNIAVMLADNAATSVGVWVGIISIAGAIVQAFIQPTGANNATANTCCALNVVGNFLAVAFKDTTPKARVSVYNSVLALQGAQFIGTVNMDAISLTAGNDGVAFYLAFESGSRALVCVYKFTTAGVSSLIVSNSYGGSGILATSIPMLVERNRIILGLSSAVNFALMVINSLTQAQESLTASFLTSTGGGQPNYLLLGPDFSVVGSTNDSSANTFKFRLAKYSNSSIQQVALTAAAISTAVYYLAKNTASAINQMVGTASKTFDGSATNIPGSKGAVSLFGVRITSGF